MRSSNIFSNGKKLKTTTKHIGALANRLADMIWPPVSLISKQELAGPGLLEARYWNKLQFLSPPLCNQCGTPLPSGGQPKIAVCAACLARPPAFSRARSALAYGEVSDELILALKWSGKRNGLKLMARWMEQAGRELLDDCDALVPVPLHYWRFVRRSFNQSLWLAEALLPATKAELLRHTLIRNRHTNSQDGKSARARRKNVAGAFAIKHRQLIQNRHLLLVDDVMTTGATLNACAQALKKAGAAQVDALTLARVASASSP